jgi:phosphoglucosamine mutase
VKLFGSSGIRGLANVEITPALAQRLGAALATIHEGGTVVIGRDARTTGEMLVAALASGIASCGAETKLVGLLPTPVIAWLTRELGADAGVAVSASHNPPEYNGLKVFNSRGMSLIEKEQGKVEAKMEKEEFDLAPWDGVGSTEELDASWMYVDALAEAIHLEREWKVTCDLFCGATSTVASAAFDAVGLKATMINAYPDGHFPAGNPEPTAESLERLGRFMRASGAEAGFGFDGDGDRMMTLDEKGSVLSPDRLLAAYAAYEVERNGGGVVVTHVGASTCVEDMVKAAGGSVVRVKVGDAYVTEAMADRSAVFGGEPVGAWIHPGVHMCPDGVLSALKLLEALEARNQTPSEFVSDVPEYPIISSKMECPNERKERTMKALSKEYGKAFKDVKSVNRIDGVRLELEDGWTLIRASGTEPLIRITVEGRGRDSAKSLMERSRGLVSRIMEASR